MDTKLGSSGEEAILAEQIAYYRARAYRIVKVYYEPDELVARLRAMGWRAEVGATGRSFLLGWATPPA